MACPGPQVGVAGAPPDPSQHIDALEAQLQELSAALAGRVAAAQAETLEHLQLFESGVAQLEASAHEAAARRAELLAAARRLALELRGLDLLERHVQQIDELVRKLEAAAADVLGSGAADAAAAAAARPAAETGG
ncbi:hypothetical protein ABPG75_013295 [Micractinium tetrahymenae]